METSKNGCAQCKAGAPHELHVQILADGAVSMTNNEGEAVVPPTVEGCICPLCGNTVSFIDPEFGNAFCSPCSWMGAVAA